MSMLTINLPRSQGTALNCPPGSTTSGKYDTHYSNNITRRACQEIQDFKRFEFMTKESEHIETHLLLIFHTFWLAKELT